jgi:hypothetical protein
MRLCRSLLKAAPSLRSSPHFASEAPQSVRSVLNLSCVASGAKGLEKWIKIARQEFALQVEVGVLCSLFVV